MMFASVSITSFAAEEGTEITDGSIALWSWTGTNKNSTSYKTESTIQYGGKGQTYFKVYKLYNGNLNKYAKPANKWVKITIDVEPKVDISNVGISRPLNNSWATMNWTELASYGSLIANREYKLDAIFDFENASVTTYANGIQTGSLAAGTMPDSANMFDFYTSDLSKVAGKGDDIFVMKSIHLYTYTDAQTMEDFEAEEKAYALSIAKKGMETASLTVAKRGGCSVVNTDTASTITYDEADSNSELSFTVTGADKVAFDQSNQLVKTKFVRYHADFQYDNYNGGLIKVAPRGVKPSNSWEDKLLINGNTGYLVLSDNQKHAMDLLVDVDTKTVYQYIDGQYYSKRQITDGDTDTRVNIDGYILFEQYRESGKANVLSLSNTYAEYYYDNEPVISTIDELKAKVAETSSNKTAVIGAHTFTNKSGVYAAQITYLGYDKDTQMGFIAEYAEDGSLVEVHELKESDPISTDTKSVKIYIWDKTSQAAELDSFSSYILAPVASSAE